MGFRKCNVGLHNTLANSSREPLPPPGLPAAVRRLFRGTSREQWVADNHGNLAGGNKGRKPPTSLSCCLQLSWQCLHQPNRTESQRAKSSSFRENQRPRVQSRMEKFCRRIWSGTKRRYSEHS